MYDQPIDIVMGDLHTSIDNEVFKAVQEYGISINKAELFRALQYDREQYKNGYADGVKEFAERLKKQAVGIGFWQEFEYVSTDDIDKVKKEMVGDNNGSE